MNGIGDDGDDGDSGSFSQWEDMVLERPLTGRNERSTVVAGVLGTNEPQARCFLNETLAKMVGSALGISRLSCPDSPDFTESSDNVRDRVRRCDEARVTGAFGRVTGSFGEDVEVGKM